jgi:hypothetical protein
MAPDKSVGKISSNMYTRGENFIIYVYTRVDKYFEKLGPVLHLLIQFQYNEGNAERPRDI